MQGDHFLTTGICKIRAVTKKVKCSVNLALFYILLNKLKKYKSFANTLRKYGTMRNIIEIIMKYYI